MRETALLDRCLTRNTRKLVKGLLARGVEFSPVENLYIHRFHGQGMMNKAAGEIAPTWELAADGLRRHHRVIGLSAERPELTFEGNVYEGAGSSLPLGWILTHDPKHWNLQRQAVDFSQLLEIDVAGIPPWWD